MNDDKALQMVRIATYDPLLLKEKNFLAGFVAREQELNKLHRVVKESSGKEQSKHCLLYGQRGMGKTSLLRRLAILIREDQALSTHWIPVNFTEEQYNISHLDNFWANCADGLAQWTTAMIAMHLY
jgi:Cdc6-like AAA superfamily ATPase